MPTPSIQPPRPGTPLRRPVLSPAPWTAAVPSPALILALALTASPALAQEEPGDARIGLPGANVAAEDDAASALVNPALPGFDPDPGYALLYRFAGDGSESAFQAATSAAGMGIGAFYRTNDTTGDLWAFHSTVAVRLPRDWTLGTNIRWMLPEGEGNNFTSWDLGVGWRPFHFLGLGAVARNIGNPAPESGVRGRYGLGVAARPFGDRVVLGLEQNFSEPAESAESTEYEPLERSLRFTVRARPTEGLVLHAYAADDLSVGGGVQIFFGEAGAGAYGRSGELDAGDLAFTGAVLSSHPDQRLFGVGRRVPHVVLDRPLAYQPRSTWYGPEEASYLRLLEDLRRAAEDPHVAGLVMELDRSPPSLAQVQELRDRIRAIRDRGRPVVVYLGLARDNAAYYLATAADRVILHPAADLDLTGLAVEMAHFRETLDTLGVEPQFFRRSEYKTAAEPMTRSEPSARSSEQMNALLDDLYGELVSGIAEGRDLEKDRVEALVDGGPWSAEDALEAGLVDELRYPDELEEGLEELFSGDYHLDSDYVERRGRDGWKSPRRVAVVTVDGTITSGPSLPPGLFGTGANAGSETVVRALEQARDDHTVKAVVLRVDSPGGSALASDEIWRAVGQVQEEGKPVVASMGGVAASGGYYVSAGADAIVAEPTTVTGSIGVVGGKLSFEGLYDKLGVETTLYRRGRHAGLWSASRPFDPSEAAALESLVDDTYEQFKSRVAEGRDLTAPEVEAVARGRVWSGLDAGDNGLVDQMGGFHDAVARARELAGIREGARVDLISYHPRPEALGDLPAWYLSTLLPAPLLPPAVRELASWSALRHENIWLLPPCALEIR